MNEALQAETDESLRNDYEENPAKFIAVRMVRRKRANSKQGEPK